MVKKNCLKFPQKWLKMLKNPLRIPIHLDIETFWISIDILWNSKIIIKLTNIIQQQGIPSKTEGVSEKSAKDQKLDNTKKSTIFVKGTILKPRGQ